MKGRLLLGFVLVACGLAGFAAWLRRGPEAGRDGEALDGGPPLVARTAPSGADAPAPATVAVPPDEEPLPLAPAGQAPVQALPRPARVRVRGTRPDGLGIAGVTVEVSAQTAIFSDPWGRPAQHDAQLRTVRKGLGLAEFPGILPGVAGLVRVLDPSGFELGREQLLPLSPGEECVVDVLLSAAPREFVVRVLDRAGAPLEAAEVGMKRPPVVPARRSGTEVTDAEGRATFGWLAPGPFNLRVWHFDAPVLDLRNLAWDGGAGPLELRVDRGRRIVARAVDESGRPLELEAVAAWSDVARAWVSFRRPASGEPGWHAEALPPGELDCWAVPPGLPWLDLRAKSAGDEVLFVQPRLAQVEVAWPARLGAPDGCWITHDDGRETRLLAEDERRTRRLAVPLLPGRPYRICLFRDTGPSQPPLGLSEDREVALSPGELRWLELGEP